MAAIEAAPIHAFGTARAKRTFAAVVLLLAIVGILAADTAEGLLSYVLITCAAVAPAALWLWAGAPGIPVLPASALLYCIYYALPVLRGHYAVPGVSGFTGGEILAVAFSVTLFMVSATIAWRLLLMRLPTNPNRVMPGLMVGRQVNQVVFAGLALGNGYFIAFHSTWLFEVSTFLGLVRGLTLASASVACFLLGHSRARGTLYGRQWAFALAGLMTLVGLAWGTLFLVGGMMFMIAALGGYAITARRVPWRALAAVAIVATVLNAGKAEARLKYAQLAMVLGHQTALLQVPVLLVDWAQLGMAKILSGEPYQSAVDRASLLQLTVRVHRLVPDYVPYLNGESYALFPSMVTPRFIDPDKTASQAGMTLLNIRMGFQTAQSASMTSIGWGLVSEAYANFGRLGLIGAGLFIGLLAGVLTRWSHGQPIVSLPSLIAVGGMVCMVNLEADMSYFLVTLTQTTIAIVLFTLAFRQFFGPQRRAPRRRATVGP